MPGISIFVCCIMRHVRLISTVLNLYVGSTCNELGEIHLQKLPISKSISRITNPSCWRSSFAAYLCAVIHMLDMLCLFFVFYINSTFTQYFLHLPQPQYKRV